MNNTKLKKRISSTVKISIFLLVLVGILIIILILFPNLANNMIAAGTIAMAFGTFLMAFITYVSYRDLIELQKESHLIQKTSLEPALSVSLWRYSLCGQKSTDGYGVTIRNDGHGIAKNVRLRVNWALLKKPSNEEWIACKFSDSDFYGECEVPIGNISSKSSHISIFLSYLISKL